MPALYLNGNSVSLTQVIGPTTNPIPTVTRRYMWLGKGVDSGFDHLSNNAHFKGVMRTFAIWRRKLSGTEVFGLYNQYAREQ